jgi:hypothetical protein
LRPFWLALAFSCGFLAAAFEAARRRLLKEPYAVLWIGVGLAMLALSLSLPLRLLDRVAHALGVIYGPNLLFVAALLFSFVLQFHLTVVVGRLAERTTRLAQELTLLRADRQEQKP